MQKQTSTKKISRLSPPNPCVPGASFEAFVPLNNKPGLYRPASLVSADDILSLAREILSARCAIGRRLESTQATREYIMHELAGYDHEVFGAIFLDNRHQVLAFEILFHGTLTGAVIYPRHIIRRMLAHNAAAIIVAHNHLSGFVEPSALDIAMTLNLKEVLSLVDARLLDHIVVGAGKTFSFRDHELF